MAARRRTYTVSSDRSITQIRELVIRPTLKGIGLWSEAAENLLVGVGLVESGFKLLKQINGPACGYWQIEPATADDLVFRYLNRQSGAVDSDSLIGRLREYLGFSPWSLSPETLHRKLIGDMELGCALARIKFWMDKEPLPEANDINGLAETWLRVYNAGGKGTISRFMFEYALHHGQPMQS